MIILDTNIISEIMKTDPSKKVVFWLEQQDSDNLFITTVTIAEIAYGINALPLGNRRQKLEDAFNKTMQAAFKHRILDFTEAAAKVYGKIMAYRKELGKPLSILDGQIAAITLSHGANLATRNAKDFNQCSIELINPFQ